jgi:glycolate oxidase iron-sulfur subunit
VVVTNSAGCGSGMKEYGHLLREDAEWAERATSFAAKVRDVSELLAEHEPVAERRPLDLRVAYHDACHLAHAQGVRAQPRRVLGQIPGVEIVEPERWEICCGSAGVYNLMQPRAAADLGRAKAEALIAAGADIVAAANPGCALQIELHSRLAGKPLRVVHPVELLHASIEGRSL